MKIAIILGTRPEIIKCSPIIRECERRQIDYFILHTGQHYSYNMDKVFFEQLKLPNAKYNLDVGSGTHGKQTGEMLIGIEKILMKESPSVALVQGDTNTVLAGAIAAAKMGIKVGHVEAGLRSYDRSMPEEINRILQTTVPTTYFRQLKNPKKILLHEGIDKSKIFVVGNTVVDAVQQNLELAKSKKQVFSQLNIEPGKYVLATSHRQENVDDKVRFAGIIKGLKWVGDEFGLPVLYPIHPRAKKQAETFKLDTSGITLLEPLDYLTFLMLESKAKLVLTDSGGVQEETCILKVPCVTLRDSTERPETIEVCSNILAGSNPERILIASKRMMTKEVSWRNPFGAPTVGKKVISILTETNS